MSQPNTAPLVGGSDCGWGVAGEPGWGVRQSAGHRHVTGTRILGRPIRGRAKAVELSALCRPRRRSSATSYMSVQMCFVSLSVKHIECGRSAFMSSQTLIGTTLALPGLDARVDMSQPHSVPLLRRLSAKPIADHNLTATCANTTSFATLLTGVRYADAALCLPRMLRNVGSRCRLLLVYNDADASLPISSLESAYGSSNLVRLSDLRGRYRQSRSLLPSSQPPSSPTIGRRLFSSSEASNTHLKVWLWALPRLMRVAFLDIDVLILRNVDSMLDLEMAPKPRKDGPGLGAVTCKSKYGERFFNSGILVLTPSLRTLDKLLELARFAAAPWRGHIPRQTDKWVDICSPAHDPFAAKRLFTNATDALSVCRSHYGPGSRLKTMPKACESKLGDQSILNSAFPAHSSLPHGYNMSPRDNLTSVGSFIVHFVGEPKPWSSVPFAGRGADPARRAATSVWRNQCIKSKASV